jgi:prepilin-type N-terminal cleavage/methylation domain-containing protein
MTRERGFTLAEMLVALAILLVGITSLLAALTSGVGLRRGADARVEAGLLAGEVIHQLRQQAFAPGQDGASVLEAAPRPLQGDHPRFPGMRWSVTYTAAAERPDLVLCAVAVQWLEEGESELQEFMALLPRQEPLGARVRRFRANNGEIR